MKKRVLSAVLAAMLVIAAAAGCGSTATPPQGETAKEETMEADATAQSPSGEQAGQAENTDARTPSKEEAPLENAGQAEGSADAAGEGAASSETALPGEDTSEKAAPSEETPIAEEATDGTETAPTSAIPEDMTLTRAVYPINVPFPNEEDYFKKDGTFDDTAYDAAIKKWSDANLEKTNRLEGVDREGVFAFTEALMQHLVTGEENCAVSPVNIYMALAMLAEISGGTTRDEVLNVLGAESIEALRENAAKLSLAIYSDDASGTAISGDAVWLRNDSVYKEDTLKNLATYYYASAFEGTMGDEAYNEALRAWLNEQTGDLLKEQAAGLSFSPETVLALTSSIYFKGGWTREFETASTRTDIFHGTRGDSEVPFMTETDDQTYFKGETFGAVCKPFNQGAMYFILPDEGVSVEEVLADKEYMELVTDVETIPNKYLKVNLAVPKFDISSDMEISRVVKDLGARLVFDAALSDFTSICDDPLVVSAIRHAARVKIDEAGCEAAAYTAVMVEGTAWFDDQEEIDFVCDRPFIFVVTGGWNLPLFVGVVNQPA